MALQLTAIQTVDRSRDLFFDFSVASAEWLFNEQRGCGHATTPLKKFRKALVEKGNALRDFEARIPPTMTPIHRAVVDQHLMPVKTLYADLSSRVQSQLPLAENQQSISFGRKMKKLPNQLESLIYSFVADPDLLCRVSTYYRDQMRIPLWQNALGVQERMSLNKNTRAPQRGLGYEDAQPNFPVVFHHCKALEILSIDMPVNAGLMQQLETSLPGLPRLRQLVFPAGVPNAQIPTICGYRPDLKVLVISNGVSSPADARSIVKTCGQLEKLDIRIHSDEAFQPLGSLSQLRTFRVRGGRVTNVNLQALVPCTALTSLDIDGSRAVTDTGISQIANREWRILRLQKSRVTDDGLIPCLQMRDRLVELSLRDTRVSDRSAPEIAKCTRLAYLSLAGCPMSAHGVKQIVEGCHALQRLNLNGIDLGPAEQADAIVKAISKNCHQLTDLDLRRTNVSDKGLAYLTKCKKTLRVLAISDCFEVTMLALIPFLERVPLRKLRLTCETGAACHEMPKADRDMIRDSFPKMRLFDV